MRTVINRRGFIAAGASLMIGTAARSALPVIRQSPKARIIIDNDFAGAPDGLIALAHQLAARAARSVLITPSALDAKLAALGGPPAGATAAAGKLAAIASFPGVKRSQTVGVPDELLGEMVVACIVPDDGATGTEADLIAHLKARMASFKVPRRVLLLDAADFALTGNEKAKASDIRAVAVARLSHP